MTTIIKATSDAEFLSLVPHLLGYVPTRSIVLIPFCNGRTVGAMRFDLPDDDDASEPDRIAATAIGMVCRLPEADAVVAVLYTEAAIERGELPHPELARALRQRADACGLDPRNALCVTAGGWGSYLDPECPAQGHPLELLGSAPAAAAAMPVADGDQSAGAELPPVAPGREADVARAYTALETALRVVCAGGMPRVGAPLVKGSRRGAREPERVDPQALAALCRLDDLPALYEEALEWDAATLAPFDAAALVVCLSRPGMRDVALVQWCGDLDDGREALAAQLRWEQGAEYPAELGMRMWGEGIHPDPERLHAALELCRHVAALSPRPLRPGPLALCAWLSWALGRSTHAAEYASQACEIEPEHGLSEIVLSFVGAGHLPDWAFHRATTAVGSGR